MWSAMVLPKISALLGPAAIHAPAHFACSTSVRMKPAEAKAPSLSACFTYGLKPVPFKLSHDPRGVSELRCCYHNDVPSQPRSTSPRELTTVFLDRDGVINEKMREGEYLRSWSDFKLLDGVPEAIAKLNGAGKRVTVVSNQRGIALGLYTAADVDAIHEQLQRVLRGRGAHVDGFFYCPHDKADCNCRKPLPGLFEQAVEQMPEIRAEASAMVGDSISDIEFGRRLGMTTVFIEGDTERRKAGAERAGELADMRCASLAEAVQLLLHGR